MTEIPGYSARTTSRGIRVIELDAWADPAKRDPEWLVRTKARSTSTSDFNREVMRNWRISSGKPYYPEFAEVGRKKYEYDPGGTLLASPVIRGWDFGWRGPACVWLQYSPRSDRVYVLRDWAPSGISGPHFRDVCRWLSGQLELDKMDDVAQEWAKLIKGLPGVPTPPWFAPGTPFVDLSGPEVNAVQSISAKDPREATLRQVWAAGGIEMSVQTGPVRARADVLRRLLSLRADGWPGILIHPACTDTLAMLDGGLVYRKPTTVRPKPDEIHKDGHNDNVHDALTYALVGIVPAEGVVGVTPTIVTPQDTEEVIGWTVE